MYEGLGAGYVCSRWASVRFGDLEADGIANSKFIKRNTLQLFRVEEEILRLAFARDEPESSVCKSLDCSGHVF